MAAPGFRGFPPPGVDRGASLPRRHIPCAAGALAVALVLAVQAPANAQDASGQPLRGSLGLPDGSDAPGASEPGSGQGQSADSLDSTREDAAASSGPLGGMGDEGAPIPPLPPLGGLGDEDASVPSVPELGITTEAGETSQQVPGTNFDSSRHRVLPPPRHDLDPYVPIGMRLGSFLLFTEAEIGTILTDNVLATETDTHSDAAFEGATCAIPSRPIRSRSPIACAASIVPRLIVDGARRN